MAPAQPPNVFTSDSMCRSPTNAIFPCKWSPRGAPDRKRLRDQHHHPYIIIGIHTCTVMMIRPGSRHGTATATTAQQRASCTRTCPRTARRPGRKSRCANGPNILGRTPQTPSCAPRDTVCGGRRCCTATAIPTTASSSGTRRQRGAARVEKRAANCPGEPIRRKRVARLLLRETVTMRVPETSSLAAWRPAGMLLMLLRLLLLRMVHKDPRFFARADAQE